MKLFRFFAACFILAMAGAPLMAGGQTTESGAVSESTKPVWQQSDPNGANYLKHRRALVGRGCEVDMLVNTVSVGAWAEGLNNLVDEDLTNVAKFPSIISLEAGVAPVVSVRDMTRHYAKGTQAGFVVAASSKGSLLSVKVVECFTIQFYLDGEEVGKAQPLNEKDGAVLGASLITIPGSDRVSGTFTATAPGEFDEICLMPAGGLSLNVGENIELKYAFVGRSIQYDLVNAASDLSGNKEPIDDHGNGNIVAYNNDYDRKLTLEAEGSDGNGAELIDAKLSDGVIFLKLVAGGGAATVYAKPDAEDTSGAPFKAGMAVGLYYEKFTLLEAAGGITLTLLGKDKEELKTYTVSAEVLNLKIGKNEGEFAIRADVDFYGVKLQDGGLGAEEMTIHYAFVRPAPDVDHHCDINPSADAVICDSHNSYRLDWNKEIKDVKWTIESQPAGNDAGISEERLATNMNAIGDYVFVATAPDGCYEKVTIHRGLENTTELNDEPLYNTEGNEKYALSTDTHITDGALINIDDLNDSENILNAQLGDYAQYTGGLGVAENVMITGVKTKDGSAMTGKKRIGFLVETTSDGLNLDALNFFCIRAFNDGKEVFNKPIDDWNTVAVDLIGASKVQKVRFSVAVPDGKEFDEFQLWKEGVLSLNLSKLNIYYAFANEVDNPSDPFTGCKVISNETTGASLNADATHNVAVVQTACVTNDLTNLIDNDPKFETPLVIAKTVNAGGSVYAVKLGRTFDKNNQVGIVMDNKTYTAGVNGVGAWCTMTTYKDGVLKDTQTDWKVVGLNAIGSGDKRLLVMQPTSDYDEVRFEFSEVLAALDFINVYGVFVRSDMDGDGVPDIMDDNSCMEELVLNEEAKEALNKGKNYTNARLVLHRNFTRSTNIGDNIWCSLVLPVSLTGLQVRNAFGNNVRLAKVEGLSEKNSNLLVFKRIDVPNNDNSAVIEPGVFYIIETIRTPDIAKGGSYETLKDGTINGEIYFIDGVNYETKNETGIEKITYTAPTDANHSVTFHGTYRYRDGSMGDENPLLPANIYAFSGGKLYHITNQAKMKGFRFYIDETWNNGEQAAKALSFMVDGEGGSTTGITTAVTGDQTADGAIYDISGRKAGNASDIFSLAPGMYIMNGKKILVK